MSRVCAQKTGSGVCGGARVTGLCWGLLLALLVVGCTPVGSQLKPESTPAAGRDQQLYEQGKALLAAGQYESAVAALTALQRQFPQSPRRHDGALALAYSQLQLGQPGSAAALAGQVVEQADDSATLAYAFYLRASAILSSTSASPEQVQLAAADLQQVVQRYGDSRYAAPAAALLAQLTEQLAQRELQAARLQLQRHEPAAAINRCRYLIEQYPTSAAVADALGVMAAAYGELGLDDLAATPESIRRGWHAAPTP